MYVYTIHHHVLCDAVPGEVSVAEVPSRHYKFSRNTNPNCATLERCGRHGIYRCAAKASRPQLAHIPFGWGLRSCIGLRFALLESKIALMEILRKFSFNCLSTRDSGT